MPRDAADSASKLRVAEVAHVSCASGPATVTRGINLRWPDTGTPGGGKRDSDKGADREIGREINRKSRTDRQTENLRGARGERGSGRGWENGGTEEARERKRERGKKSEREKVRTEREEERRKEEAARLEAKATGLEQASPASRGKPVQISTLWPISTLCLTRALSPPPPPPPSLRGSCPPLHE